VVRARATKVVTGAEGMIGEVGVALHAMDPRGTVLVHGEYWDAVSSEPVPKGARVEVVAVEQLRLTVKPVSGG
jgi:membrane-bound serine protease (ClpP class)